MKTTQKGCRSCADGSHALHVKAPDGVEVTVHRYGGGWIWLCRGTGKEQRSLWVGGRKTLRAIGRALMLVTQPRKP